MTLVFTYISDIFSNWRMKQHNQRMRVNEVLPNLFLDESPTSSNTALDRTWYVIKLLWAGVKKVALSLIMKLLWRNMDYICKHMHILYKNYTYENTTNTRNTKKAQNMCKVAILFMLTSSRWILLYFYFHISDITFCKWETTRLLQGKVNEHNTVRLDLEKNPAMRKQCISWLSYLAPQKNTRWLLALLESVAQVPSHVSF